MSAEPVDLSTMARSKLHSAMGGSLHRWVLLKNSIFRPPRASYEPSVATSSSYSKHIYISSDDRDNEDDDDEDELDSFMFPDASKLVGVGASTSEAEWLDSLLESLVEDDEDPPLSPLTSPMSSSDDLLSHQAYVVPYPVPYPPFHPPLVHPYDLGPIIESPVSPFPAYDALPYYDADELDDLSVPEAIEDTSDDESDALSTPSLGRSSELDFVDPTSLPLPGQRRRRRSQPHVYIRHPDSYFDRYALDPLPFPDEDHSTSYNAVYHEC
ncbi:uncharacterized protein BJ212DRAFT_1443169 [Suillus subaureus]|uniref:Uncharacterized protein n=1 Tax=Suillus subaureus TaxID=48587 RepID=A0A9P7EP15_9AGAM|nr:uncharacterized protein BJ212DRAFT_1443169 [Suillus subaureus]KAG1826969.1 hypothetical protein BJ212DRAFT_1443169 [Suillus subaureus]